MSRNDNSKKERRREVIPFTYASCLGPWVRVVRDLRVLHVWRNIGETTQSTVFFGLVHL